VLKVRNSDRLREWFIASAWRSSWWLVLPLARVFLEFGDLSLLVTLQRIYHTEYAGIKDYLWVGTVLYSPNNAAVPCNSVPELSVARATVETA